MRRVFIVVVAGICLGLGTGVAAWAQDAGYPPASAAGDVSGASDAQGTAFTGGDMTVPIVLLGSLLVLGGVAFVVARRRARAFTSEGR